MITGKLFCVFVLVEGNKNHDFAYDEDDGDDDDEYLRQLQKVHFSDGQKGYLYKIYIWWYKHEGLFEHLYSWHITAKVTHDGAVLTPKTPLKLRILENFFGLAA